MSNFTCKVCHDVRMEGEVNRQRAGNRRFHDGAWVQRMTGWVGEMETEGKEPQRLPRAVAWDPVRGWGSGEGTASQTSRVRLQKLQCGKATQENRKLGRGLKDRRLLNSSELRR